MDVRPLPDSAARSAAVVLLAGGSGSRMQAGVNKVYLPVGNRDMLTYSFRTIIGHPRVEHVVLVIRPDDQDRIEALIAVHRPLHGDDGPTIDIVPGGASRHRSEYAGIHALRSRIEAGVVTVVAVHDGARPFATEDLWTAVLIEAATHGAAIPGCPIDDVLFATDRQEVVPAGNHVRVQTPQAFEARALLAAHDAAAAVGFEGLDTSGVVETFSDLSVRVVAGEATNIKVTRPEDLPQAETIAATWR